MKAKQAQAAKRRKASHVSMDDDDSDDSDDAPKINLFSANSLAKASIKKAKKSKLVQLPSSGMNESQLFAKYRIESEERIGAGAFARIKVIKGTLSLSSGHHQSLDTLSYLVMSR